MYVLMCTYYILYIHNSSGIWDLGSLFVAENSKMKKMKCGGVRVGSFFFFLFFLPPVQCSSLPSLLSLLCSIKHMPKILLILDKYRYYSRIKRILNKKMDLRIHSIGVHDFTDALQYIH